MVFDLIVILLLYARVYVVNFLNVFSKTVALSGGRVAIKVNMAAHMDTGQYSLYMETDIILKCQGCLHDFNKNSKTKKRV